MTAPEVVSPTSGLARLRSNAPGRPTLRALAVATLALIALLQLLIWYKAVEVRGGLETYARGVDFTATLTGARIVRDGDGAQLYDLETQRAAQARVMAPDITPKPDSLLPYIHPPFEALLVAPLIALPYGVLYLLWSGLILLAIGASLMLLARALPVTGGRGWLLVAAICSYGALYQALWLGQSSPLVLLGLCGAYVGLKQRRDGWAGAALALMVLKPQMLLVFVLLLFLARRWRVLALCAGILAGAAMAAMPFLGVLWPLHYARFLSGIPNWTGSHHEYPQIMHNWRGLVFHLLGGVAPGLIGPVVAALTVLSLVVLVWIWWRSRGEVSTDTGGGMPDPAWAAGCILAVLIAPHLYIHDLLLLVFPAWIIVSRLATGAWAAPLASLWLMVLWSIHLLALLFQLIADIWPTVPIIPTILLIAVAAGILVWQVSQPAHSPDRWRSPARDWSVG